MNNPIADRDITSRGNLLYRAVLAGVLAFFMLGAAGCEQDGPVEEAGEEVDQALENAGDAIEDAADEVEDEVE